MTEFITRNHGNSSFEVIIKTTDHEHYQASVEFARGLIDHKKPATDSNVGCKWIPVTKRLPENNKPVLVYCSNTTIQGGHIIHIGSCDSKEFWFLRTQPGTASFPIREWKVTHWMPLPEPPKEVLG